MTKMTKPFSSLWINQLELSVHLGWHDKERLREQIIYLDIEIQFAETPKACETDHLDHTICYSDLIDSLRKHIASKKFHLIENLAYELYLFVKMRLHQNEKIWLHITKHPPIAGLKNVRFSYGDEK